MYCICKNPKSKRMGDELNINIRNISNKLSTDPYNLKLLHELNILTTKKKSKNLHRLGVPLKE